MARAPAVIVIARHGARLDAADKSWHLTSPTPYDPPLTYGGWSQSRALGTRIASLLHAREESSEGDQEVNGNNKRAEDLAAGGEAKAKTPSSRGRRRKHKIIVHSSPFLRCIQTSVGIGAGIAQFQTSSNRRNRSNSPNPQRLQNSHDGGDGSPSGLETILEPEHGSLLHIPRRSTSRKESKAFVKTTLRVDAFLGEWLTPDYFELITPPPNSTMMVAGAKADLLRRGEYIELPQSVMNTKGHFPGGWVKGNDTTPTMSSFSAMEDDPLSNMSSLTQALPLRDRSGSIGSVGSTGSRSSHKGTTSLTATRGGAYIAPTPAYAISPSDPIPRGYVAHARDACIEVDFQWDSMREPQEWGDGGEYGEEWSSMHKRFRRGINSMVEWYKLHGPNSHGEHPPDANSLDHEEVEDEDTDIVLVLVTHGAGCNALIGALTNQPVLLDVGMASLTMAVRKENEDSTFPNDGESTPPLSGRRFSTDSGLSEQYEIRLVASSEHLRPGVDPAQMPQAPSPKVMTNIPEYRRRFASHTAGSPLNSPLNIGESLRGVSSALGSIRRSNSQYAPTNRLYSPNFGPASAGATMTGLWSRTQSTLDGTADASNGADAMVLNFADATAAGPSTRAPVPQNEEDKVPSLPTALGRTMSQHGLWGSAPSGARNERSFEKGPKRRWTVSERDA